MVIKSKELASSKYVIALKKGTLLKILDKENQVEDYNELWVILENINGVSGVEYNGHFGNYIYLEIKKEHDSSNTWRSIYDVINNYI